MRSIVGRSMVYSETLQEHVEHVSQVLECLSKRNLHLKPEKCEFHREEVDFLGFVFGRHGIRMDPEKLRAVKEWKPPINVKEVQAFMGFINYNKKFTYQGLLSHRDTANQPYKKEYTMVMGTKPRESIPRTQARMLEGTSTEDVRSTVAN